MKLFKRLKSLVKASRRLFKRSVSEVKPKEPLLPRRKKTHKNPYRKQMKGIHSKRKLKTLRRKSAEWNYKNKI